jgi:hypothetical protein
MKRRTPNLSDRFDRMARLVCVDGHCIASYRYDARAINDATAAFRLGLTMGSKKLVCSICYATDFMIAITLDPLKTRS